LVSIYLTAVPDIRFAILQYQICIADQQLERCLRKILFRCFELPAKPGRFVINIPGAYSIIAKKINDHGRLAKNGIGKKGK
jgi:hypothetical protein